MNIGSYVELLSLVGAALGGLLGVVKWFLKIWEKKNAEIDDLRKVEASRSVHFVRVALKDHGEKLEDHAHRLTEIETRVSNRMRELEKQLMVSHSHLQIQNDNTEQLQHLLTGVVKILRERALGEGMFKLEKKE